VHVISRFFSALQCQKPLVGDHLGMASHSCILEIANLDVIYDMINEWKKVVNAIMIFHTFDWGVYSVFAFVNLLALLANRYFHLRWKRSAHTYMNDLPYPNDLLQEVDRIHEWLAIPKWSPTRGWQLMGGKMYPLQLTVYQHTYRLNFLCIWC
jgi:hypothetical protein